MLLLRRRFLEFYTTMHLDLQLVIEQDFIYVLEVPEVSRFMWIAGLGFVYDSIGCPPFSNSTPLSLSTPNLATPH